MVLLPVLLATQAGNMLTSLSASHHRRLVARHGLRRGADGEEGVLHVTEIHLDRTGFDRVTGDCALFVSKALTSSAKTCRPGSSNFTPRLGGCNLELPWITCGKNLTNQYLRHEMIFTRGSESKGILFFRALNCRWFSSLLTFIHDCHSFSSFMIAGSVHDCSNSLQMPFIQMITQSNIRFDWLMHVMLHSRFFKRC